MPYYDPQRCPPPQPEDAVAAVHAFLTRCRAWALEQEIPKRLDRLRENPDPREAAGLHEWVAYLKFTEHALAELENGDLDPWFAPTLARETLDDV